MKLDHLTILARDLDASARFYRALFPLLGLREEKPCVWTDDQGFFVQLLAAKPETRPYERYGPGMNHVGFGAASEADVDRVHATMRGAGFDVPAIQRVGRAYALFLPDPDGLRMEVTYTPPGEQVVDGDAEAVPRVP